MERSGWDVIYSESFPSSNITNPNFLTTVVNSSSGSLWLIQDNWVNGTTPKEMEPGNYYIKLVNMANWEVVAVTDTYITLVILGHLHLSPDTGIPGVDVQFTGIDFTPNEPIEISYYDPYTKQWNYWETQTANDTGAIQFTKEMPDLGLSVTGINALELTKAISFKAYGNGIVAYVNYHQYLRGLKTVGEQTATTLYGNGSDLSFAVNLKVGDSFEITGKNFHPNDAIYVRWDGQDVVGTITDVEWSTAEIVSTSIANSTGGFSTEFPVPVCSIGEHYLSVEDTQAKVMFRMSVTNSTTLNISPSTGTGGSPVLLTGYGLSREATVDLMYLNTAIDEWQYLSTAAVDQNGKIEYSFTMPDLGRSVDGTIWQDPSTTTINFRAQIDNIIYSTVRYDQYLRGLKTVGNYTVDGLFGNSTDLTDNVRVESGDSITITGQWFHPQDVIYVRWDGASVVGTVTNEEWADAEILDTTISDSTGNFSLQVTIPTAGIGDHYIAIEDSQTKVIIKILLSPSTIQINPSSGPGGKIVTIRADGLPASTTVNLEYLDAHLGNWDFFMSNTSDISGNICFAFVVPDLQNTVPNGTSSGQYELNSYRVVIDEAIYGRVEYTQYYRGLVRVGNTLANNFFGNGTNLSAYVKVRTGDSLNLAGSFFHPGPELGLI